jgi:small subunit ribosomal protein S13
MGSSKIRIKDEKLEEDKKGKSVEKPSKPKHVEKDLRALVRVSGTDLDGDKKLFVALTGIKGISHAMSKAICDVSGFDPNLKLGSMKDSDINKLEEIIKNPMMFGIPAWMINRRMDIETGKDIHLTGSDLDVAKKFDIQKMVDMKSWKGFRHMLGQPVRGQRTRSHFRGGRIVGVVRKAVRAQLGKTATSEKEKGKEPAKK